jgi:RNA polymerase sigma factor (sigma-70 family)
MTGNQPKSIDVEQLYLRYGPMVLRRCRQLLKNEENAVDAMQEVFVRLLTHQESLHGQYPSSLLYRIATNICLNLIRDRKAQRIEESEDLLGRIAHFDEQETRTLAGVILDRMFHHEPASTREIAVSHYVDGLTYPEVAREFRMSASGVRKRLRDFRARAVKAQEE